MRFSILAFPLVLAALACDASHIARGNVLSLGDPCTAESKCREPLVCGASGKCEPSHAVPEGGACAINADCAAGLYCAAGLCAPAGDGILGDVCLSSADCAPELRCGFAGFGATCIEGGEGYVAAPCSAATDCYPGLVCDPVSDTCQSTVSAPWGEDCQYHTDCAPEMGLMCDATAGLCTGYGPDAVPIVPWDGVSCGNPRELDGAFRVYFEVSSSPNEDFFRLPFPNDARIVDGKVSLPGFPKPQPVSVPDALVERYIQAIEQEQTGFGPNQTVFMRFSGQPVFCGSGCGEENAPTTEDGCMGNGEAAPSIYVVDLTRDGNGDFASAPFTPVPYSWMASTANEQYICGPWLAVMPDPVRSWVPGHTYGIFVHGRVKGCDGQARVSIGQDADFAAMLSATAPTDATELRAWNAYEPLRAWLATSPSYPSGGAVPASDLAAAAVFTVRDPTTTMQQLAGAVASGAAPTVGDLLACTSASVGDRCSVDDDFTEVQGTVALPSFQQGTVPYLADGGGVAAPAHGTQNVRFALSVPKGTPPAGGWPVVVYAHGTGGDYRSHLDEGLAATLADVAVSVSSTTARFAVLGVDQVGHGTRRGASALDPERVFFNYQNPRAARGNVLQGAADQLALVRAVAALSAGISGLAGLGGATLDAGKVTFLGHSQGATVGVLGMSFADAVDTVVLSGGGGRLLDSFNDKTSPYPMLAVLRLVLADPYLEDARIHPVLSLVQGYMEEADPINYARLLNRAPPSGLSAKHVLSFIGVGDTYTPNSTAMSLARRMETGFIDAPTDRLTRSSDTEVTPPVRKNKTDTTAVTSIHAPASGAEGHFVLFDVAAAQARMAQFFGSWLADSEEVPTVVP